MRPRVLVTGATGFVGRALVRWLVDLGWPVRAALRRSGPPAPPLPGAVETVTVGELGPDTDWGPALDRIELVVHLAARVHVMGERGAAALAHYRRTNVEGSRRLAEAAQAAGVRRLLLMSSVKAVGDGGDGPLTELTVPAPSDPYGRSKLEAEAAVREAAAGAPGRLGMEAPGRLGMEAPGRLAMDCSGRLAMDCSGRPDMDWVVLRPPLVYGPGVGANFLRLLELSRRGWPLPLGAVDNRRSLVFVDNLADAVIHCLIHPSAAGRCFFIHDGEPLAVPELIRRLAGHLGRPARLLPVPPSLLRLVGALPGLGAAYHRLCGSLEVDDSALRCATGWSPPFTTDAGLRLTADWFLTRR
jgi:nucleoside-diphosphate-sugar epimerase